MTRSLRSQCPVRVTAPSFEQHHNGFGVQHHKPRISWRFSCNDDALHDWVQTAYDLEARSEETREAEAVHVESHDSSLVQWPDEWPTLKSRERKQVRVRCYGKCTKSGVGIKDITEWSPWNTVEAALLDRSDWSADMITSAERMPLNDDGSARPLSFRTSFALPSGSRVSRARLYATSHGVYQAKINGKEVGDQCMAPGWQSYHKRLHYQVFDVTKLLIANAENSVQVDVGPGWFASALSWSMRRFNYGEELGVLAQLEIYFEGQEEPIVIVTKDDWHCTTSAVLSSEIYAGEVYDQRLSHPSTISSQPVYQTKATSTPIHSLNSPNAPPVCVTERLKPKKMFKSKSGKPIIDFGQNLAGRICIKHVHKPAGTRIVFRHAEIMENGELGTRQLRGAAATDTLICGESSISEWHPRFTFHGFRYAEIAQGWSPEDSDSPLTLDSIVAEVMHCDMRRTGWFSCSAKEVNQLHKNASWSMRGNFLSVPTDDPQRDERLGWTGDLNMFSPVATFLYDTAGMLGNWLEDLHADQMDDDEHWQKGVVPLVVPNCIKKKPGDGPGWDKGWDPTPNGVWADAAVMVPWQLYVTSGDRSILTRQYSSMLDYLKSGVSRGANGLWDPEVWQFGDWLDPSAPTNDSGRGRTDGTFVADCYLLRSTELMSTIAQTLGHLDEGNHFRQVYDDLLAAFQTKYLTPTGLLAPDTPTAYALALTFNLLPLPFRAAASSRLIRALRLNDFLIPTGFVGTAHLLHALSATGNSNVAYATLFANGCPSLLYPVRMGATTIWERWDALKPDGSVNEGAMTSFNHYALGSVVSWLHQCCAGIKALAPGRGGNGRERAAFEIKPEVHHALEWAEAKFDSRVGMVEVKWRIEGEGGGRVVELEVVIPPNARARIVLPGGRRPDAKGTTSKGDEDGSSDSNADEWFGSGKHQFTWKYIQQGEWPVKPLLPPWGRAEY